MVKAIQLHKALPVISKQQKITSQKSEEDDDECDYPQNLEKMMIRDAPRTYPTVEIPPWPVSEDLMTAEIFSPAISSPDCGMLEALAALQRYLPSNELDPDSDPDLSGPDSPIDAYSCDHFRMYDFKVRRCVRGRSHDWTECPYAHPGEKARRRDPRKYHYTGTACPDFRKGFCEKGDSCEFAHGVFECWLHPARYRTQPCKDGGNCRRRVCFFAHSPDQLRFLHNRSPDRVDSFDNSSPIRHSCARAFQLSVSPVSGSPPISPRADSESSPLTQSLSRSLGSYSVNDVIASFRKLQFEKVKSFHSSYSNQLRCYQSGFGSPQGSILGPGFQSLPTTPTRPGNLNMWENGLEEEPVMKRVVESGREVRAKMLEKLSKENCMDRVDADAVEAPDVGWVSDLVM